MHARSCLFANTGFPQFIAAVVNGDVNTVNMLLKDHQQVLRFDLDQKHKGLTALEIALRDRHLRIAAKLIHAGANTQIKETCYISDDSWVGGYEETTYKSIINLNKFDFAELIDFINKEKPHQPYPYSL